MYDIVFHMMHKQKSSQLGKRELSAEKGKANVVQKDAGLR